MLQTTVIDQINELEEKRSVSFRFFILSLVAALVLTLHFFGSLPLLWRDYYACVRNVSPAMWYTVGTLVGIGFSITAMMLNIFAMQQESFKILLLQHGLLPTEASNEE